MRIKVVWKEFKFVIPTGKSTKVSDFCKEISSKFAAYSQEEFFVSELKTVDGFIISPHLLVEEALVENDILVVIDFESWKNEQFKLCNKSFTLFTLENFEDNNSLRVNVGLNTMNKLFVSIGLYSKLYRLELFDAADLKAFHKEGDHPVSHWEDGKGNYAKVFFVVADGVVKQVKSEILTVSAPKPLIQTIDIKLTAGNKIEAGQVKLIQKAYSPYDTDSGVSKLPEEVRVGKSFVDYENYDYYTTDGGNGTNASTHAIVTGSSDVRFEQVDIVRSEMGNYPTNNGGFWNSFFTDFQITNNADQRVTLSKITAEYQDKEGNWQPMVAVFGTKRSNQVYDYTWRNDNILIPLDSRDTIKLSTNTRVEIKGKNSERLSRSDRSLPNELHIKVHIHDDKQNVTTIPLFYKNKTEDPVGMTLKTRQARVDLPIVFFQTVDNFETNVRGFTQITTSTDDGKNIYILSCCCSNSSHYISESALHSFVYQAKKSNEKTFRIQKYCDSNSNFSIEAFANINFDTSRVESIIFELSDKNGVSKSTKHFPITKYISSSN